MVELQRILDKEGLKLNDLRRVGSIVVFNGPGGDAAIALWEQLRKLAARTKHWPVLLGGEDDALELEDMVELLEEAPVAERLESASRIDGKAWFEARLKERAEEFEECNPEETTDFFVEEGDWPDDAEPRNSFSTPFNVLTRKPQKEMVFGLVPTLSTWEVPAYLCLGNWNEYPAGDTQCAVMKYWYKTYKAEIVAATRDVIELRVGSPPTTREKALALAREQYTYCADIVDQGCETLANLAATLLNGKSWYFWWD